MFAGGLELDSVRVLRSPSPTGAPLTLGDVIRVPPGWRESKAVFLHELVHVWQYQTRGSSYISDSFLAQSCKMLEGKDRDRAYDYALVPGKRFVEYSAEQQAEIVEDYFAKPALSLDARYIALLAELRRTTAVKGHAATTRGSSTQKSFVVINRKSRSSGRFKPRRSRPC